MNSQQNKPRTGRLRPARLPVILLKGLLLLLSAALFWTLIVMARTDPADDVDPLYAYPGIPEQAFSEEADFLTAAQQSPYAVLAYPYGTGAAFSGGSFRREHTGRTEAEVWEADYTVSDGFSEFSVRVRTIVPNTATDLLGADGFSLTGLKSETLSGIPIAHLERSGQALYYGKSSDALYTVSFPTDAVDQRVLQNLQFLSHQ